MALFTVLLTLSVLLIAFVLLVIQQTFFNWKREQTEEARCKPSVSSPAVGMMMTIDRSIFRKKCYPQGVVVYDLVTRSDASLQCSMINSIDYVGDSIESETAPEE